MVVRKPGLPSAAVADELVVLDPALNNYVSLDAVGRRIWEIIEQPIRLEALVGQLRGEFRGEAATIAADVNTFLDALLREGLIDVTP